MGNKVGTFLIGGLVGAAVALLYAPRSGYETRAMVTDKMNAAWGEAQELGAQASDKAQQVYQDATSKGQEVVHDVAAKGQQAVQDAQSKGQELYGAGRRLPTTSSRCSPRRTTTCARRSRPLASASRPRWPRTPSRRTMP